MLTAACALILGQRDELPGIPMHNPQLLYHLAQNEYTHTKIKTQSYKIYKLHFLPNGKSFLVNQSQQGKGCLLLLHSCKRRAGLGGSPSTPQLVVFPCWIHLSPGMTACASTYSPHPQIMRALPNLQYTFMGIPQSHGDPNESPHAPCKGHLLGRTTAIRVQRPAGHLW